MPHHEIHASGSLDNSGCKRLRISSLVDMPEEEDISEICVLYASGIALLDEMSIRCIATEHWSNMLKTAFAKEDVNALNKVIGLLQQRLAAHPGGPAAAEPAAAEPIRRRFACSTYVSERMNLSRERNI